MPTLIPEFTHTPSRQNPATFSADMDSRLSEENSRIVAMNTQAGENNAAVVTTTAKAAEADASATSAASYMTNTQSTINNAVAVATSSASLSATNAATSATQANSAALRAEAVVIPTAATYSYTQQDWRQSMMSKAEFNAMAAERRANRAGSGADNFGKGNATIALNVNEGIHTSTTTPNTVYLGKVGGTGTSLTDAYIASINGSVILAKYLNATTADATLLLPPAPTVLPSTATLTQQQIDSGVIKHSDDSNSGLIVNGKFNTDTSGWTGSNATLSIVSNAMRITCTTNAVGLAEQIITTVIGKKYIVEYSQSARNTVLIIRDSSNNAIYSTTHTAVAGYYKIEFTATTSTTKLWFYSQYGTIGEYTDIDNIAVFPADAISRSDLVFLESDDYVDISVNDFVYPLGNKQFLGTTSDCGTTVVGAFAGSATYSLFSDLWQADGALVGRGYIWSTLSDLNKKLFVSNPENNCYLDGDKVIQVQYKVKVEQGKSDLPLMSNYSYLTNTTTDAGLWYK